MPRGLLAVVNTITKPEITKKISTPAMPRIANPDVYSGTQPAFFRLLTA